MPRTRRRCLDALLHGGLAALLSLLPVITAGTARAAVAGPLTCTLAAPTRLPAGQPVRLDFGLRNGGTQVVELLVWGTPFEPAWFAPYVSVWRGDTELRYGGAKMKRGDPPREQYLRIEPGETRHVSIDLAAVFDLGQPGRYRVKPRIVLHDVAVGAEAAAVPRPLDRHVGIALNCNAVEFEIDGR